MNDINDLSQVLEQNTNQISLRELLNLCFERYKALKKEKENHFKLIANKLYTKYNGKKDLTCKSFDPISSKLCLQLHCNKLIEDYVLSCESGELKIEETNSNFSINKHDILVFLGEDITSFINYLKLQFENNKGVLVLETSEPEYRLSLNWNKINLFSKNEIYSLCFDNIKDIGNIDWELLDSIIIDSSILSVKEECNKIKKRTKESV